MMTLDDICDFLSEECGAATEEIRPGTDLYADLSVDGDDFFELAETFQSRFSVDMSSYRWYFRHGEEGWSPGGLFFKAPQSCVERIPVTPRLLLESANSGRWMLKYPEHYIPPKRYDLTFNAILVVVGLLALVVYVIMKIAT
jgi:hypothetical protein